MNLAGNLDAQNIEINFKENLMFISVQKINFTTQFFLKILQRNNRLVILGNLRMPGHTHLKWYNIAIWRNFWRLCVGKRSSSSITFSMIYYKDIVNLLFWVLWACLVTQTQSYTINLQKTFVFICRQKIMVFWRYWKDIKTW